MYWNVFNATKNEDVVYLEVKNVTRYESGLTAEEMLRDPNGNSQESEAEFAIRKQEYPNGVTPFGKMDPHNRMSGAFGSFSVETGTGVRLNFTFLVATKNGYVPYVPPKVVVMTILDIDGFRPLDRAESVGFCTGKQSFGYSNKTSLRHNWTEMNDTKRHYCHNFSSTLSGNLDDNPWNPANIRQDWSKNFEERPPVNGKPDAGLTIEQRKKLVTAAFYGKSSFSMNFKVQQLLAEISHRHFVFGGQRTSFCELEQSCKVKHNFCHDEAPNDPICLKSFYRDPVCEKQLEASDDPVHHEMMPRVDPTGKVSTTPVQAKVTRTRR